MRRKLNFLFSRIPEALTAIAFVLLFLAVVGILGHAGASYR